MVSSIVVIGAVRSKKWRDVSGLGVVLLQALFFIPGFGATFIFGRIIFLELLPSAVPPHNPYFLFTIVVYAGWIIPVVQNMIAFFWDFKNESIIA